MTTNSTIRRAVRLALASSAAATAMYGVAAVAQDAPPQDDAADVGTIVVTGSRIKSANLEATTPVTQVTSEDVVTQGVTRIEDLVNQLPQAFAAQNVTVANGATGAATLNLRGLGSPRTLVLVDGRRLPYGSVTNSAADINTIPTQMVERVDILTGGASAVYGSDAVAGVVNFVMKKDFEGVEVTSQYNFYWHENDFSGPGQVQLRDTIAARAATNPAQFALPDDTEMDGEGYEGSLMLGVNSGDGRGNLTGYFTVFDSDQVLQRDRDYSACSLAANPTVSFGCGGSATSAGGLFTDFANYFFTADTPAAFRNFSGLTDNYNFGPLNHYQRPERRYSLGAMGHYEFSERADAYTQLMFTDYRSIAQIAPGGNFFNTSTINCDNPLLPPANLAAIGCDATAIANGDSVIMYIGRRNVEGGGRQESFKNQSFRALGGLRGAINDAWSYDVSGQFSSTSANESANNYFVIDRLLRSLDVISDPRPTSDTFGQPVCSSVLDNSDPNCVPYNPFVPGGVTPAALNYLQAPGVQQGTIDQEIYNGVISGDLGVYGIKMPWASDGAQVVFGTEYRRDSLTNTTDGNLSGFQLAGTGGPTIGIDGAVKVTELFFEGRLPIAQDRTGMQSLSLDVAYRYSDYGDVQTDTYKGGLEWAPTEDIRFRGSFQRAVRAANIVELFTAQGFNLYDLNGDPCGIAAPLPGASQAECIASGVPASYYDGVNDAVERGALDSPAGQYNFLQGGFTGLQPEESDTQSVGIILTPRFAPGLSLTVDWFNIQIDDTISTFGAANTLSACYESGDGAACGRINRIANGSLWVGNGNVEDLNTNIGSLETTGVDVNLVYRGIEIGGAGSLGFDVTGTWVEELITDPGPLTPSYDCVGKYSAACGTPTPEIRTRFRTSWLTPWDVDLSLTWRHYSGVTGITANPNVTLAANRIDRYLPSEDYFDLAANWQVTEQAGIILGINNITDDDPSITASVGTTGNGNTFPQTYDAMGRYVFLRATVDF